MEQNTFQEKRLYRSKKDRIIFGVCGGLGEYFNIDPIVFRIIFVALTLGAGSGILLYLVLAFLTPRNPASNGVSNESSPADAKERVEGLAAELREIEGTSGRRNIVGIVVVIFGAFLLLNQLFPWRIFDWGAFWAAVIIIIGFLILRGRKTKSHQEKKDEEKEQEKDPKLEPEIIAKEKEFNSGAYQSPRRGGGVFRLFFGLIFVIIGFGFLAQNFDLIPGFSMDVSFIWSFWPALIILAGLSILSRGTIIGTIISVLVTMLIVAIIFFFIFSQPVLAPVEMHKFEINKEAGVMRSEVIIKAGASSVNITGGGSFLVSGSLESNISGLETGSRADDGVQRTNIGMEHSGIRFGGKLINRLSVVLDDNIPSSMIIDSGASDIFMDATSVALDDIRLNTGASKVMFKFGDKAKSVRVDVKAGASSIEIVLPKSSGARIESNGALNQNDFIGFKRIDGNTYETEDYAAALTKFNITLDSGVSKLSIVRSN